MSWRDVSTKQLVKSHTTKSLFKNRNNDYEDFYNTFKNEGFALILNLAQGGAFPRESPAIVQGQPQFMKIANAKVYGF